MITLQHFLNKSALLLGIAFAGHAFAGEAICPKTFDVLERDKGDKYVFTPKVLDKLYCNDRFEGEHFKIVYAKSDEAIAFNDENKTLVKKAANVYYHLMVAHDFWVNEIKAEYVTKLPQIVVRLDITNAFSDSRHYMHDEQQKNYNNAWSIPEGESPPFVRKKISWGKEIWFSPMKKIEQRKEVKSKGDNPVHQSLLLVKEPITDYNTSGLIYDGLTFLVTPTINQSKVLDSALIRVGTIAVLWGLIETSKHMDEIFMEKYFYVDTAMVPEIIYHEFAHIAMSDTMKTIHSVPVIEGMADYFAARIATRRKMYDKLKGFSNNNGKDTQGKQFYHPYLEGSWNATSEFTLSMLWKGYEDFKSQNEKRVKKGQEEIANYDDLVYKAHFKMTESTDIMNGLTRALIDTCHENCNGTRAGVNILNSVFEKKGI